MSIDRYSPCPCGSGKKIKFCCSADIFPELEKVQRMLDGDQRLAALEKVDHVLEEHPGRAALLSIKAMLENQLGQTEKAEATVNALMESAPESSAAFIEKSRLQLQQGDIKGAVNSLQNAINTSDGKFSLRLFESLGILADMLVRSGHIIAGRAHLLVHASLGGEQDTRALQMLMQINSADEVPLLLKQDTPFAETPADEPYADAFADAVAAINRVAWQQAVEKLEAIDIQHPKQPPILRNLAILRSYLTDEAGAVSAWRQYAAAVGEENDDAVEAEALAQVLDNASDETVELLELTYPLTELDPVMEKLLADRRVERMDVDPAQFADDGSPPPKGVFTLLDREMPASAEGLTIDSVPNGLADLFVFGKETDKPARVVLSCPANEEGEVSAALAEVIGQWLEGKHESEQVDEVSVLGQQLTWSWRMPADATAEQRMALLKEKREQILYEVWPTCKMAVLKGKSPQEAADDADLRLPLLAAILTLELEGEQRNWEINYDRIRTDLGLPVASQIDPWKVNIGRLPVSRYRRLDAVKMETPQLADCFQKARVVKAIGAMRSLGDELVGRTDLNEENNEAGITKAEVYHVLASVASNIETAVELLQKGREITDAQGQSPATWLLAELPLRIQAGQGEEVTRLIGRLQDRHINEPGVGQALMDILVRAGIVRPDGSPAGMPPEAAMAGAGDAGAEKSALWTPGGDTPASSAATSGADAAGSEKKSSLWVPGMD